MDQQQGDLLSRDLLTYSVEHGHVRLELTRGEGEGDRAGSSIYLAQRPNLVQALTDLMGYHNDCLMSYFQGETSAYFGAGSDRGQWHDRELRVWRLAVETPMSTEQKTLLEGIVQMHNQIAQREEAIAPTMQGA